MDNKKIGSGKSQATRQTNQHSVIEVMKPFVYFGVKAMAVLGTALIHIVKNIPKPDIHKANKGGKVIKI